MGLWSFTILRTLTGVCTTLTMSTLYADCSLRPIWRAHCAIYRSFRLVTGGSKPPFHSSTATSLLVPFLSLILVLSMVSAVSTEDQKFLGLSSMSSRANAIVSVSSTNLLVVSLPYPLTITIWVSICCLCLSLALIKNSSCYCGRWY